ncbi:MAG TPA: hypothetical protein VEH57_01335 [Thermoplasmata archaeon]|nr:hypothetical protein [Thermoplasmata archaeon]
MAGPIVRNDLGVVPSPRGVAVREFAALEYPREDFRWIAAQTRPAPAHRVGLRTRWGRFWHSIGSHAEMETGDTVPT